MPTTTYANLVIESQLPQELRNLGRKYDKKMVATLLREVATRSPELYDKVVDSLLQVGDTFATRHGLSFDYDKEFLKSPERDSVVNQAEKDVKAVLSSKMPEKAKLSRITEIFKVSGKKLEDAVLRSGKKRGTYLYKEYTSGAKGNPLQLRMINEAPLGVVDHKDRPIPMVIKNSYAEGLTPGELFAASYGARKGLMATKMSTADTGAFEKALTVMNISTVITEHDCGTSNGLMFSTSDNHNVDKYLAAQAGSYSRNELITDTMLSALKRKGVSQIRVRSPMTCEARDGGLCSKCFGKDENNRVPSIGDNVGVNAAQGMAEPLTQMSMDTKHTGGAVGSESLKGGFQAVRQLLTVPKNFTNAALVAPGDGPVSDISKAPQGGSYVVVAGQKLYAPVGTQLSVKKGDMVRAGDVLSDGMVNPVDMVNTVGLGAARTSMLRSLRDIYKISGKDTPRRHFEVTVKNMLSHVEATDLDSGHLPGDVFKISAVQELGDSSKHEMPLTLAAGKYLARNYLEHTIGTKIGARVVSDLQNGGITKVMVTERAPAFSPKVSSLVSVPRFDEDFLARLGSSHLKDSLLAAAHLGHESKLHNTKNPIPAFVWGADFGRNTQYY